MPWWPLLWRFFETLADAVNKHYTIQQAEVTDHDLNISCTGNLVSKSQILLSNGGKLSKSLRSRRLFASIYRLVSIVGPSARLGLLDRPNPNAFNEIFKEVKVSTCKQIFVLGAPRSGTTFLSSLLKKTSFDAPVETHFITKYYKRLRSYADLRDRRNFRRLVKDILSERPVQQWHLNLDIEKLYDELPANFVYGDLVNAIILKRKQLQGRNRWGDKTPHYLGDLDILVDIFPKAHFIYIVRDGRDVALSLLEKPWGPNNILKCAEYWSRLNDQFSTVQELKEQNRLYFLKYEDLLINTKEIVPEIYNFLNEKITETEITYLAESVQLGNYNKWKKKMTPNQIRIFEAIASKELTEFGYDVINTNPMVSILETQFFNVHEIIYKAWYLFNLNIVDGFKIRYLGKEPFSE